MRISHAQFHRNRLTAVQDIQDHASLIFLAHTVVGFVESHLYSYCSSQIGIMDWTCNIAK